VKPQEMHLDVETGRGRSRKGEGESLGQNNSFEGISVEAMTGKETSNHLEPINQSHQRKSNQNIPWNVKLSAFRCI